MSCPHENFSASVSMDRITADEGGDPYTFHARLRVHCVTCGEAFAPINLPMGFSFRVPTCLADGQVTIPMVPMSAWVRPATATFEAPDRSNT